MIEANFEEISGGKREITFKRLFSFFKESKVLTERKQMEELYRQCVFSNKQPFNESTTFSLQRFQSFFLKPLLLVGFENLLSLVDFTQESATQRMIKLHSDYMFALYNPSKEAVPCDLPRQEIVRYIAYCIERRLE